MSDELVTWLSKELKDRRMSMRELARLAGVSHATVSQVLSYQQKATWNFCAAIAGPLQVTVDEVFVLAGLKRRRPPPVEEEREVVAIVRSLPADVRGWLMVMLRGLAGRDVMTGQPAAAHRLVDAEEAYDVEYVVDDIPGLTDEERRLLHLFREASPAWQRFWIEDVQRLERVQQMLSAEERDEEAADQAA